MEKLKSATTLFKEQNAINDEVYEDTPSPYPPGGEAAGYSQSMDMPVQQAVNMPQQFEKKKRARSQVISNLKTSEELQLEKEPIRVKITGMIWKKVIVPPNVYVVHTRIHRKEPVTIGLGVSFKYRPATDSYLIVPAAMQTIGVVANCISREKQGINILAYVQWQIEDFSIAFKKLDFSDSRDPLAIVNAQLREQAEAAIKDKISTMSVEDVLTDKVLIMEELTKRLKIVAEGQSDGLGNKQEGLGIKIITVQIREALVSSTTLWEYLQSPFRNEQQKKSNISLLEMQDEIKKKELETKKQKESREAETNTEIEVIRQKKQTEIIELKLQEDSKRFEKEQLSVKARLKLEEQAIINKKETEERIKAREQDLRLKEIEIQKNLNEKEAELKQVMFQKEHEIERIKLEAELLKEKLVKQQEIFLSEESNNLTLKYEEEYTKILKMKQEIGNLINSNSIARELIEKLPEIASSMPKINDLKIFQTGASDPLLDNLLVYINKFIELFKSLSFDAQKKEK